MNRGEGLTAAQRLALTRLAVGPVKRGFFNSGWEPSKAGQHSHKVGIREATANALIARGFAERWEVEDDHHESTLRITDLGRTALTSGEGMKR